MPMTSLCHKTQATRSKRAQSGQVHRGRRAPGRRGVASKRPVAARRVAPDDDEARGEPDAEHGAAAEARGPAAVAAGLGGLRVPRGPELGALGGDDDGAAAARGASEEHAGDGRRDCARRGRRGALPGLRRGGPAGDELLVAALWALRAPEEVSRRRGPGDGALLQEGPRGPPRGRVRLGGRVADGPPKDPRAVGDGRGAVHRGPLPRHRQRAGGAGLLAPQLLQRRLRDDPPRVVPWGDEDGDVRRHQDLAPVGGGLARRRPQGALRPPGRRRLRRGLRHHRHDEPRDELCGNQNIQATFNFFVFSNGYANETYPNFDISTRGERSSKNQPNRLRFDRARDFRSLVGTPQTSG